MEAKFLSSVDLISLQGHRKNFGPEFLLSPDIPLEIRLLQRSRVALSLSPNQRFPLWFDPISIQIVSFNAELLVFSMHFGCISPCNVKEILYVLCVYCNTLKWKCGKWTKETVERNERRKFKIRKVTKEEL